MKALPYQMEPGRSFFIMSPLDIDNLNLIGENEHIIKLIAEFTSAKTTHVSIDQKNNIFMSDIMGGILYAASEKL